MILSIDTSCDETAAAITEGNQILSNVIWSQASLHAQWGGVVPSLAQRMHEERINWVVDRAIASGHKSPSEIDAIAVTAGPGLSIALGVGVNKAKELSQKYDKPIIPVNHIEGHLLSPLARPKNSKFQISSPKQIQKTKFIIHNSLFTFPALGLVVSGGTTQIISVEDIGKYKILATTADDALGDALDKAARMLGFGYPGAAVLEKMAKEGNPKAYPLPIPMIGQEDKMKFSYSGLKTAMWKMVNSLGTELSKEQVQNLAASFQNVAFEHIVRVLWVAFQKYPSRYLLVGGGVAANVELRRRLKKLAREFNITPLFPYSKKLYGDNAAMIGIAAHFKFQRGEYLPPSEAELIDRFPRWPIDQPLAR